MMMNIPVNFILISNGFQLSNFTKQVRSRVTCTASFVHFSELSWTFFLVPSTVNRYMYIVHLAPYSSYHLLGTGHVL